MLAVPRLLLLATTTLAFGPPSITVEAVTDAKAAPIPGAVFVVKSDHHHDAYPLTAHGRAEGIVGGQRVSRPLTLVAVPGKESTWAATRQWQAGLPWVLVFSVHQGEKGKYGVAEAIVRVAADGRVLGIERLRATNQRGDNFPRAASEKEIESALATLARGT